MACSAQFALDSQGSSHHLKTFAAGEGERIPISDIRFSLHLFAAIARGIDRAAQAR